MTKNSMFKALNISQCFRAVDLYFYKIRQDVSKVYIEVKKEFIFVFLISEIDRLNFSSLLKTRAHLSYDHHFISITLVSFFKLPLPSFETKDQKLSHPRASSQAGQVSLTNETLHCPPKSLQSPSMALNLPSSLHLFICHHLRSMLPTQSNLSFAKVVTSRICHHRVAVQFHSSVQRKDRTTALLRHCSNSTYHAKATTVGLPSSLLDFHLCKWQSLSSLYFWVFNLCAIQQVCVDFKIERYLVC